MATTSSNSSEILWLLCWMNFVLLYAYYGGALTMFFASGSSPPFSTLEEGADKLPTWKFLHLHGADMEIVRYRRSDGKV